MSSGNGEKLLQTICGARLTSVQFVMDYLILGFDNKGALTALVWPEIHTREGIVKFGTCGYRDRLCELIPKVIRNVAVTNDDTIIISFEEDTRLRIPLLERETAGETAIFTNSAHQLWVWYKHQSSGQT